MIRYGTACALMLCAAAPVVAQDPAHDLADVAFMSGCWRGEYAPGRSIEEFYSTPSANVMVGTTRYLNGNRVTMFEFSLIHADSTGVYLTPHPRGSRSEHSFRLTRVEAGPTAYFEAPEHDYPKRIIYRRNADGSNTARIDGGPDDSEASAWTMQRVACHP